MYLLSHTKTTEIHFTADTFTGSCLSNEIVETVACQTQAAGTRVTENSDPY